MSWQQFLLELLKTILSWPVAISIIGILFLVKYKQEISSFMSTIAWRISRLRGPAGTEAILQNPSYDPALLQELEKAHVNEKAWFFTYLNVFYVSTTKQALLVIALTDGINGQDLLKQLRTQKPVISQDEFTTIIEVLTGYNIILEENDGFHVTQLGREYLDFLAKTYSY